VNRIERRLTTLESEQPSRTRIYIRCGRDKEPEHPLDFEIVRIRHDIIAPVHDDKGSVVGGRLNEEASAEYRCAAFHAGNPCPCFPSEGQGDADEGH
jgi:hypothetical protein